MTDMSSLFYSTSFNEDIGAWDTSSVTGWTGCSVYASEFNQDISAWAVDSVTDMSYMFSGASAFDQDLGWCVDDDVARTGRVLQHPDRRLCGVKQGQAAARRRQRRRYRRPQDDTRTNDGAPTPGRPSRTGTSSAPAAAAAAAPLGPLSARRALRSFSSAPLLLPSLVPVDKAHEPPGANPEPTELLHRVVAIASNNWQPFSSLDEGRSAHRARPPTRHRMSLVVLPRKSRRTKLYNQIAAWYNAPENAALRATWGASGKTDIYRRWPGFSPQTNAAPTHRPRRRGRDEVGWFQARPRPGASCAQALNTAPSQTR